MDYQIVFESENIIYIKLNEKLIKDYLVIEFDKIDENNVIIIYER